MIRHPNILKRGSAALLIVDVQEKFIPVIDDMKTVETNIIRLINGCKLLGVPAFYTEQYSKGLGQTVSSLKENLEGIVPVEKLHFSVCCEKELMHQLREKGYQQLIVTGIEAHVCVLQSSLDLIQEGFQAHVVVDAVSSRKSLDKEIALHRMASQGVTLTTTESVLFELVKVAGSNEFKQISKLVK
jgi:isochorismate hydrolase